LYSLGERVSRTDLGLPQDWRKIASWLDDSREDDLFTVENNEEFMLKNPEIPVLADYCKDPGVEFWQSFPSNYPEKICKKVDIKKLQLYVQKCWFKWSHAKRKTAKQAL